jgi:hypothetical protein
LSSVRRIFYYLVSLVTLGILAGGLGVLLSLVFDVTISSSTVIGQSHFSREQFSLGLAMLVIGGPLWWVFWRSIRQNVGHNQVEIGSIVRQLYLNLILCATALTALATAQSTLQALLSGSNQGRSISGSLAACLVALVIWFYHWRMAEREGLPSSAAKTLHRWYIYIVSGWSLVLTAVGVVVLVDSLVRFLPFWGNSFINSNWGWQVILNNVPAIILGGGWWAFHWLRLAARDTDSSLRQVYLYLLAIVGSSIAGLTALVMGLYQTLVRATGGAGAVSSAYFQYLGWVVPTLLVTVAIWVYHQSVAREESATVRERQLSSRRIHLYLMSFIGLGALTYGLFALFGTLLNLILNGLDPAIAAQSGWWQKQLSLCLALLIAGTPLWLYYWNQIVKLTGRGGIAEGRAISRRIYLYLIVGAAIIALAAGLVNIVYQILSGALGGSWGLAVLQKSRWSIQTVIVIAPLLVYHWQIARQDQRRGSEAALGRKTISALIDSRSRDLFEKLQKQIGTPIRIMEYTAASAEVTLYSEAAIAQIAAEIQACPEPQVMLVEIEGRIKVVGYKF